MSDRPAPIRPTPESRKGGEAVRRMMAMADVPREAASGEESEDWVVSYMDMVTLLMIVFLTLVGMLWIDKKTRPTVVNVLQIETGQMQRRDFADAAPAIPAEIGRASCRGRVCE